MKIFRSAVLLLLFGWSSAAAFAEVSRRTDFNPALLYWHAWAVMPELSPDERNLLQNPLTVPLDAKYESLVTRYDTSFRLVRRAAQLNQPCEWGVDIADGPEALFPHLAKCKSIAQAARMRARYFLAKDQATEALQDLLAAFTLGRRAASDGILISTLVQFAIENIVIFAVAENFHAFPPETLKQLIEGLDASPARGTVSQCMVMEKRGFVDWYTQKIQDLQARHPGNAAKGMSEIRELLATTLDSEKNYAKADKVIQTGGGTAAGLLKLLKDTEPYYEELQRIAKLPYDRFAQANAAFFERVEGSKNPWLEVFMPALERPRGKEFYTIGRLEMVRAAVEYRLRGEAGLRSVKDPFGSGPFGYRRFVFQGVDRGFELKSNFAGDFPEVLILVEKAGPPFQVLGPSAGKSPLVRVIEPSAGKSGENN